MREILKISPAEIEKKSFEIITEELGDRSYPPGVELIVKRVIHTTADFDYADNLRVSDNAFDRAKEAIAGGATIITDTRMAWSGINKRSAMRFGCEVKCFMDDPEIADAAKRSGSTRASASMDKAASIGGRLIFAIGNAPTALIRICELIDEGRLLPSLVVAVPVGFVNVEASKEMLLARPVPQINALGRKGGSNVAAAIINAILYQMDEERGG